MSDENLQVVLKFVHDFLGHRNVGPDDDLIESGVLDSLHTAELVFYLESRLKQRIRPETLNENTLRTARTIASLMAGVLASSSD